MTRRRRGACGRERYNPGAERSSGAHTWPARSSKGGKGERRATGGGAGRRAARGRRKGGAPTWYGRGPPRENPPWGGENQRQGQKGDTTAEDQCSSVLCAGREKGSKDTKDKPKKNHQHPAQQRTTREGPGGGWLTGCAQGEEGPEEDKKTNTKRGERKKQGYEKEQPVQGARNSPSGPRHWVAGGPVGYRKKQAQGDAGHGWARSTRQ